MLSFGIIFVFDYFEIVVIVLIGLKLNRPSSYGMKNLKIVLADELNSFFTAFCSS